MDVKECTYDDQVWGARQGCEEETCTTKYGEPDGDVKKGNLRRLSMGSLTGMYDE